MDETINCGERTVQALHRVALQDICKAHDIEPGDRVEIWIKKHRKDSDLVDIKNLLLKACINRLAPSQAAGILDEIPDLLERGFPDEWSASEILWSYTD